jgi:ubiquinol-cytochrome c reductase iron-sulfur subunit
MANDGVNDPVNTGRRRFLTATTAVVGARAKLAGAPVTADISALQEGQRLILEWRGQPIWIVKRSKAILQALPGLDGRLKDPESDNKDQQPDYVLKGNPEFRSIKPDISVLVGLCTHLGCAPEMVAEIRPEPYDAQWKGGYFCPCHKSRFDMSGRVFQDVPAPINLLVPPHHYVDDNTIVIGVDPQGAA